MVAFSFKIYYLLDWWPSVARRCLIRGVAGWKVDGIGWDDLQEQYICITSSIGSSIGVDGV